VRFVRIVDPGEPGGLPVGIFVNPDNVCLVQDADPGDRARGFFSELTHSGGKQLFRLSPEELAKRISGA
jgi:hypothetical protein